MSSVDIQNMSLYKECVENSNDVILSIDIGKKNLGYTIFKINEHFEFGIFNITQKLKEYKLTENMEGRNKVLIEWLKKIVELHQINHIVVEKQVISNVVAMCLQSAIMAFSITMGIKVEVFDPKRKFTVTNEKYNSSVKEHKKIVVRYAYNIIQKIDPSQIESFLKYTKKDDISDSIVMALMSNMAVNISNLSRIMKQLVTF